MKTKNALAEMSSTALLDLLGLTTKTSVLSRIFFYSGLVVAGAAAGSMAVYFFGSIRPLPLSEKFRKKGSRRNRSVSDAKQYGPTPFAHNDPDQRFESDHAVVD